MLNATTIAEYLARKEPEGASLDYKRDFPPDHAQGEIAKDVSAFSNSGGGVIIYGVDADTNGLPTGTPGVDQFKGREPSSEWYAKMVKSAITPLPDFELTPILDYVPPGKMLLAVSIARSTNGPHMVRLGDVYHDRRFYLRRGAESAASEEAEVRFMYFQAFATPALRLSVGFVRDLYCAPAIRIWNVGTAPALKVRGTLFVGAPLRPELSYEQACHTGGVGQFGFQTPILMPSTYSSILLATEPGYQEVVRQSEKTLWIGNYEDASGHIYENQTDFLDLTRWDDQVASATQWPAELEGLDIDAVGIWSTRLAQQVRRIREAAEQRRAKARPERG